MAEEMEPLEYNSENRSRQTIIAIRQHNFQQALKPPPWLDRMESPFKWARTLKRMLTYYLMYRKLHDYKNQGAFYGFEKFAILLVIVLRRVLNRFQYEEDSEDESETDESEEESNTGGKEEGGDNEDDEREEYYYELEEALAKCEETLEEMAANEGDVMYSRIGPVFHHVLQATKAHIFFLQKKMTESQELARNIQDVEEMPLQCKAGFEGLRVKFIMSMYQDYTVLLPLLSKAIELDPQFGYWHYLTGKVIRRLRREFKEKMVIEELEHFKKAVELERNPKFLVFLAQAYQEMAMLLFFSKDPKLKNTIDDMLRKSVDLFRECWSLKNDSAPISRRVGNGMLKMKAGFIDKVVAKEALMKALELWPKGSCLAIGKYYYLHEMDDKKALEYFKRDAPSNLASQEIIRLNLVKDPNYDPHDDLKEWLEYPDQGTLKQQSVYCDCGWYYLTYKKDLETSVKYFWEVLKMDYKSFKVMEYQSYGFLIKDPINMVQVLVNEILLLRERNESLPPEERKDLKFLENFLEKVLEKHPDLRKIPPKPNLLGQLKRKVERAIVSMRKKRYGANFRSEPSCRVEDPGSWRNNRPSDGAQENDNRRQEGDSSRRYNNWSSTNRGNNGRSDMRNSFSIGDDDRSNRGDRRRNSESQSASNWGNVRTSDVREETSNQSETSRFSYNNRGRTDRQYNSYNSSRYDVTVTDWRSENRRQ